MNRIKFKVSLEQYIKLKKHKDLGNKKSILFSLIILSFIAVFCIIEVLLFEPTEFDYFFMYMWLYIFVLDIIQYLTQNSFIFKSSYKKAYYASPILGATHEMFYDNNGFYVSNDYERIFTTWQEFCGIYEDKKYYYILSLPSKGFYSIDKNNSENTQFVQGIIAHTGNKIKNIKEYMKYEIN